MVFKHLLAKSSDNPDQPNHEETLFGHTLQVKRAMEVFDETLTRHVMDLIGTPDISNDSWQTALFISAWLHDLGKANNHFQSMIRNPRFRQGLRHESLGIIIIDGLLTPWLSQLWSSHPPWLKIAVLGAIGGHHLKFPDDKQRGQSEIIFLGGHPQVSELLEIGRKMFKLGSIPKLSNTTYSLLEFGGVKKDLMKIRQRLDLDFTPEQSFFTAALKATLMASDLAGSALPPKGKDVNCWLRSRLATVLERAKLADIVTQKLQGKPPRPFQKQVQESQTSTTLVVAGCGSGKSAAAYLWTSERADGKRVFFCYPTTATASEGFCSYFQDPDFETILITSRANVDYRLLENMPQRSKSAEELRALQLEALDTWPIPLAVCTVHTVLGLLQNNRRALYAWPSIARSIFVFDEIHSFPDKLFQHLLRFLEIFRYAPVLLMTATLPPERKDALQTVCKKRGGLTIIPGPDSREKAPRYMLKRSNEQEAWNVVKETLSNGGKALWICNTVDRAIDRVKLALEEDLPVQPFHSRYRYRDRVVRQRSVIDGFKPDGPPMLAVTTQVAEMSLDISSDLLVTEYAPVACLIQRLGRLNRYDDEPSETKPALFIEPVNGSPYQETELTSVGKWLDAVADHGPKSQRDLAKAFLELEQQTDEPIEWSTFCDWIDDPWISVKNMHAIVDPGYTIEIIREEDLNLCKSTLTEVVIPMPFPKDKSWSWRSWERKGRYLIAPYGSVEYDEFWGGKYVRSNNEHWTI